MVQGAGGQMAVVEGGAVRLEVTTRMVQPVLHTVVPACIALPPSLRGTPGAEPEAVLVLRGTSIRPLDAVALCRQNGHFLAVEEHATDVQRGTFAHRIWPVGLVPGYAELEVQACNLLSAPRPVLVLPNVEATAEVNALAAATPVTPAAAAVMDAFLREVGLVVGWTHREAAEAAAAATGGPARPYSPALLQRVADMARRLTVVAAARGCAALVALLLEGVFADGSSAAEAVAAMDLVCPPSLLQLVAASGCPQSLKVLCEWGTRHGLQWETHAAAATAGGAPTPLPLNFVAVLADGGVMHDAPTTLCPAAMACTCCPIAEAPAAVLPAAPRTPASAAQASTASRSTLSDPGSTKCLDIAAPGTNCCYCSAAKKQLSRPTVLYGKLRIAESIGTGAALTP